MGTAADEVPEVQEKEDRNYVKAQCKCAPPAVIRVSPKPLARRSILCSECQADSALAAAD